jgi:SAM-dependent methyltransferase
MQSPALPARLRRSNHLSWFTHMGAVYLFHDLYGYLMEMSPDIADLVEAFEGGADTEETIEYFRSRFGEADPRQFVEILSQHAVLIEPSEDEIEALWAFVPIKAKWNVWKRREDRLTLWTAWGERPVQQVFLDPDETKIWDALNGEKRLIELRHHHDNDKIINLVRRLVHSDVQALKLSMMPWALYAKRPGMAPPYLSSTMPYAKWKPGQPVPQPVALTDYYKHDVTKAEEQFDHIETTLSHLLRVPHPVLGGRTYGQALADALVAKNLVKEGRVQILEIGAGLGYVAQHVIERLHEAGRAVDYTILELAPALADAQKQRLGDTATWILGDALAAKVPEAAFDLIVCNEMVGDLPAETPTPEEVVAVAGRYGVNGDDAPTPCYLQTGAFQLIERIARWLAPGGAAVVTEFGDVTRWPVMSSQLDHPELSTHFGHLTQTATFVGLKASVEFVIDLLDVDRSQQGLATTRSHFRALRALAADAGIELPKIGYTPELLAHTVSGKLDLATIGELRWDRVEDRLMGLVPHEFKALLATKPS